MQYGPLPWQWLHWYDDETTIPKPLIIFCPGGGWGLRDPRPVTDPAIAGPEPFAAGALLNSDSVYHESYRIAVVNVASNGFNGLDPLGLPKWEVGTMYELDEEVAVDALYDVNGVFVAPAGKYRCTGDHVADDANRPNGSLGIRFWIELEQNDTGRPKIPNRGDGTPAFGVQGAVDMMRAIAFARVNAWRFYVIPDKIGIAGSSAGGNNAGLAAALSSSTITGLSNPGMTHRGQPVELAHPNAAMLRITPQQLDLYAPTGGGGQFRNFMSSLYGPVELRDTADWVNYPDAHKRSLDVYRTMERNGQSCPILLDHMEMAQFPSDPPGGSSTLLFSTKNHANLTDATMFNTTDVHHPRNGWNLLELLQRSASEGGLEQSGCLLREYDPTAGWIREYHQHPGQGVATGTEGTHYTRQQVYAPGEFTQRTASNGALLDLYDAVDTRLIQVAGEQAIEWFNDEMGV